MSSLLWALGNNMLKAVIKSEHSESSDFRAKKQLFYLGGTSSEKNTLALSS